MPDYRLHIGNRRPSILKQLLSDGMMVNLSGATVKFYMYKHGVVLINGTAGVVVNPTLGVVRYDFGANDLASTGHFTGYFKVTFPDTTTQIFPDDPFDIEVTE